MSVRTRHDDSQSVFLSLHLLIQQGLFKFFNSCDIYTMNNLGATCGRQTLPVDGASKNEPCLVDILSHLGFILVLHLQYSLSTELLASPVTRFRPPKTPYPKCKHKRYHILVKKFKRRKTKKKMRICPCNLFPPVKFLDELQ